jgi:hypothetical protein
MADDRPVQLPPWLAVLDDDDVAFLRRFLLADGSLKDLAAGYGISYPTVRGRLDRLIAKVTAAESAPADDPFERTLRAKVADGSVSPAAARDLRAARKAADKPKGKS